MSCLTPQRFILFPSRTRCTDFVRNLEIWPIRRIREACWPSGCALGKNNDTACGLAAQNSLVARTRILARHCIATRRGDRHRISLPALTIGRPGRSCPAWAQVAFRPTRAVSRWFSASGVRLLTSDSPTQWPLTGIKPGAGCISPWPTELPAGTGNPPGASTRHDGLKTAWTPDVAWQPQRWWVWACWSSARTAPAAVSCTGPSYRGRQADRSERRVASAPRASYRLNSGSATASTSVPATQRMPPRPVEMRGDVTAASAPASTLPRVGPVE